MKKLLFTVLLLLCVTGCVGCKKEKDVKEEEHVITSEDYERGNTTSILQTPILVTDMGHYYYSEMYGGWRYYDMETGQEMYLCNKPECKHDGNAFCVATNSKYRYERFTMYNEMIYATAVETTDTQYLYKLIAIALDGSELTEVATYMTTERMGQIPDNNSIKKNLCIHRNKALIPMTALGEDGLVDSRVYGTALLDLDTKEVEYLDEAPLGKDNPKVSNITGHGDYIYYYRREGKKNVLHRRNILDNTDESYKLLAGFDGRYAVLDENTVVYLRLRERAYSLCVHNSLTGENVERDPFVRTVHVTTLPDGTKREEKDPYMITEIATDGMYLYVEHGAVHSSSYEGEGLNRKRWLQADVRVLDYDFNEVALVNMTDSKFPEELPMMAWRLGFGGSIRGGYIQENLYFLGEDIYVTLYEREVQEVEEYSSPVYENGLYTFKFKRSDLLKGDVTMEFVYKREEQE
ncbi:MAG: hypothetical protein E7268_09155 [Lachnospiraceae bacterium]|nr:hypothetical protein [Lachnospiraceae bacterium]